MSDDTGRFGRAKQKVNETVGRAREVAGERIESARDRLYDATDEFGERFRDASEKTRDVMRGRYEDTSDRLHEGYDRMRGDLDTVTEDVTDYVRENPGRTILLAAVVGFLLGLLFRRQDG